jgi:hypothetical protein
MKNFVDLMIKKLLISCFDLMKFDHSIEHDFMGKRSLAKSAGKVSPPQKMAKGKNTNKEVANIAF